jgi:hypothetical protein
MGLFLASRGLAQEPENTWPRELSDEYSNIVIYQPQIESFAGNKLESRAAISVKTKDQQQPLFGAVWFECQISTDTDTRMVYLERVRVSAAKFPDVEESKVTQLSKLLEKEIPEWNLVLSLDQLLTSMEAIDARAGGDRGLKNDPPEIIFVDFPAVLILIDGDPILTDLEDTDLKVVANTAFFIIQDPSSKRYYLKGGETWYVTDDLFGEWQPTKTFPSSVDAVVEQVDAEVESQEAEATKEGEAPPDGDVGDSPVPQVIVRTQPAELVETDGEPNLAPLADTDLLYVTNTENDIAYDLPSQTYYVLLSGRWYKSKSLRDGDWSFAPQEELPVAFESIPADSDMSQVRVNVAGTQEAKEAVLENQIPQTAEVARKTATLTVTYDGDPQFDKCAENVAYAVNTDKTVLLINGQYYCCDQAIWFVSNRPDGGWEVATEVPKEVQDIPPDCPAYNVKYVYIFDSTPEVVYVGYTPAYYGSYIHGGVVVWGTGWWYRPWYGSVYYPRPYTWGFHVHYNPVTGWGFSWGVSYGWLHISYGRPWYGGWWGPAGYHHGYRHGYHRGYHHGYHRGARAGFRAGYRAGQRQPHANIYRNPKTGVKRTGGKPSTRQTAAPRPSTAQVQKPAASKKPNNMYADRSGNVYRNQGGNNWQKQNNRSGGYSAQKPPQSVQRDYNARQRSTQRAPQARSRGGRRR